MVKIILRGLTAILVGLGTLAWLWLLIYALTASSDPMGNGLAYGYAFVATLLFSAFVVPAGFLVYRGKWLSLALVLALIPLLAGVLLS
ncbi:hypothetical protein IC232_27605 [Microvirga sp. BT688]|uniref:hypothetical protein n=1 Tax=Microvirga sp. TaxID=1873136 RepID=UPI0016856886|nr:hypothetical protein [Microvirga sp.]MBD2750429.1 hypothetical protein [Microvirga sp.]